jgi:dynein heavy chain
MVYIDSNDIRWYPYVKTWSQKFEEKFGELFTEYLLNLFNTHIDKGLTFVRKNCKEVIKQVRIEKSVCFKLLDKIFFCRLTLVK